MSGNNLQKSVRSFSHVGPKSRTQVIRVGSILCPRLGLFGRFQSISIYTTVVRPVLGHTSDKVSSRQWSKVVTWPGSKRRCTWDTTIPSQGTQLGTELLPFCLPLGTQYLIREGISSPGLGLSRHWLLSPQCRRHPGSVLSWESVSHC